MKTSKSSFVAIILTAFVTSGCDNICSGDGACGYDDIEIKERIYEPESNNFTVALDDDGEFNSHQFTLGELETIDELSFGVQDAGPLRLYNGIKKIHILNASALKTYKEKYVIPGKDCPVSFMHQNLQNLLLVPANDVIAQKLESYDIPFDGRGTSFEIEGHFMEHKDSYFIEDGEKVTLDIPQYETAMSNFGTAQHKINYFLVTKL
jgi:hypothetical protein